MNSPPDRPARRVLVIKLSALGDFIQAMGPFAAIRAHHRAAEITLLTTRPFADLARRSPYFDQVWIDSRPRLWQVAEVLRLKKLLRSQSFDMVYDLQTSDRSASYFHLMGDPPWSGIAHGCSHPHSNPDRDQMHSIPRQAEQLAMAGIAFVPPMDLSWLTADCDRFRLPARFVLLVPGGAAHRPEKRWPAERYAELANRLAEQGYASVLLGSGEDRQAVEAVAAACPRAMSLLDKTDFADIAALSRRAAGAVGNDTGPMHLIAGTGCPSVVLFSAESDPGLCAPVGQVAILKEDDLALLAPEPVLAALAAGPGALRPA